jgi:hypothetical protein
MHQIDFEQLSVRYDMLEKNYNKLKDKYYNIKARNEKLLDENSSYLRRLQEIQIIPHNIDL